MLHCYFLSQSRRHQSTSVQDTVPLGLSEESDAVILIVSEETGAISLAYNANIYYNLDLDKTKNMLIMLLSGKEVVPQDLQKNDNGKEEDNAE